MNRYRAALETLRTIALVVIALAVASPCTPPGSPAPESSTSRE